MRLYTSEPNPILKQGEATSAGSSPVFAISDVYNRNQGSLL